MNKWSSILKNYLLRNEGNGELALSDGYVCYKTGITIAV